MHQSISTDSAAQFKLLFSISTIVTVNRSEEVWVESQTLNRVVSTQVAHLLSQQQPGGEEGTEKKILRNDEEETRDKMQE